MWKIGQPLLIVNCFHSLTLQILNNKKEEHFIDYFTNVIDFVVVLARLLLIRAELLQQQLYRKYESHYWGLHYCYLVRRHQLHFNRQLSLDIASVKIIAANCCWSSIKDVEWMKVILWLVLPSRQLLLLD